MSSTKSSRRRGLRAAAIVAGAGLVVFAFDGVTYAATGSSLILGKSNSAGAATTISRTTSGPVLTLKTSTSSSAPFSTNGGGKVSNLNADKVDGLSSEAFTQKSQNSRVWQNPDGVVGSQILTKASLADVTGLSFTAPADGFVLVTASTEFRAESANTYVYGELVLDGTNLSTRGWDWDPGDVDGWYDQQQQQLTVVPITKGAHALKLQLTEYQATTSSKIYNPRLTVMFFPGGGIVDPPLTSAVVTSKASSGSAPNAR